LLFSSFTVKFQNLFWSRTKTFEGPRVEDLSFRASLLLKGHGILAQLLFLVSGADFEFADALSVGKLSVQFMAPCWQDNCNFQTEFVSQN
jgi:hypothetical protein